MQPDPIRCAETAAWIRKGRKDLWRADAALTLNPPDTEDCLFHCQQAVEKSLKAFLVWRDQPFRKTHDIVELAKQCADLEPALDRRAAQLGSVDEIRLGVQISRGERAANARNCAEVGEPGQGGHRRCRRSASPGSPLPRPPTAVLRYAP